MQTAEFEKMRALGGSHWWFLGRKHLLRSLLRSTPPGSLILDAGCGTGLAEDVLSGLGTVVGVDIALDAVKDHACESPECICLASIDPAPFADRTFDLVVALDIIEHIEDDCAAVREMHRICRPGGRLLLTVPAYDWLRSTHDDALGHLRRYTARQVGRIMNEAGYRVEKLSYAVAAPFPAVVAIRFLRRLRGHGGGSDLAEAPGPINLALTVVMRAEAWLLKSFNLPFGLSVVAVGVRDQD